MVTIKQYRKKHHKIRVHRLLIHATFLLTVIGLSIDKHSIFTTINETIPTLMSRIADR